MTRYERLGEVSCCERLHLEGEYSYWRRQGLSHDEAAEKAYLAVEKSRA